MSAFRYGFLQESHTLQDPLSISIAVLQHFNVLPEMYQIGYTKLYLRSGQVGCRLYFFHFIRYEILAANLCDGSQIGVLEDRRKQVLQGILCVQKHFRGSQARHHLHEISKGVTILQSCKEHSSFFSFCFEETIK